MIIAAVVTRLAQAAALCVLLSACAPPPDPPSPTPLNAPPVESDRIRLDEAQRWTHRRAADADLDADGTPERIILVSDVQIGAGGVPLWEDGHRWAVIVEDGEAHTLLYGAFVPNGDVEAAVLAPDATNRRDVLVRERTPQRARTFVIAYEKPGTARTVSGADNHVEQWIPSLTQ
jgi:hypothetical protein